jgi:outer membrane protein assembly factor BamB
MASAAPAGMEHIMKLSIQLLTASVWAACVAAACGQGWTHLAGDAARTGMAAGGPRELGPRLWTAEPPVDEDFVWLSSPVAADGLILVGARWYLDGVHTANLLIAYDAATGDRLRDTRLPRDTLDSWSTPAIDTERRRVIAAVGSWLFAIGLDSGDIDWRLPLATPVVNASPAVTHGLVHGGAAANRALITTHAPFGVGMLHAVNLDAFDAAHNPFQPGEIAWSRPLGPTSGNTPAFADGIAVVADAGGSIRAFDALDGAPLWSTPAASDGFFSGVTIRGGFVYAASYDFNGGGNNSELVKLDLADGRLVWTTPCERTAAIPVVADDGRVFLPAGIAGFGSAVKVQAFRDRGASAELLWDTDVDTGGALRVGGWTNHALYSGGLLYCGAPDGGAFFGPYVELMILDTTRTPSEPEFVIARHAGAGGSPALAGGRLFSIGEDGLVGLPACDACDVNCDGAVDAFDIEPFVDLLVGGRSPCAPCSGDANGDGAVDSFDIEPFIQCLVQ